MEKVKFINKTSKIHDIIIDNMKEKWWDKSNEEKKTKLCFISRLNASSNYWVIIYPNQLKTLYTA